MDGKRQIMNINDVNDDDSNDKNRIRWVVFIFFSSLVLSYLRNKENAA